MADPVVNTQFVSGTVITADWLNGVNDAVNETFPNDITALEADVAAIEADLLTKAPLASPVFTGNPTAPTPSLGDADTSVATTGFVSTGFNTYGNGYTNLVLNPHGFIRQESSAAVSGPTGASYFSDQWLLAMVGAGAVATANVGTAGPVSAYNTSHMLVFTATLKASLAAGDYVVIIQPIEGTNLQSLQYGISSAKGSWLRWRASSSQSGTASLSIRNAANNRSFVHTFSVTTTPTDYSVFVPGDTTGTWLTTTDAAARIGFCFAAGTTFTTATLDAWQAGEFYAGTGQSNMLDTVNRQLNITDVSWMGSPVLVPFQAVDFTTELLRCQRYYWKQLANGANQDFCSGFAPATNTVRGTLRLPVRMRISPFAGITAANIAAYTAGGTRTLMTGIADSGTNADCLAFNATVGTTPFTVGQGSAITSDVSGAFLAASARM